MQFTDKEVWQRLSTVIDPELHIDVVSLGLVYAIEAREVQGAAGVQPWVHIVFTLTTPGCPLAAAFDGMLRTALDGLPELDVVRDVTIELTFDPPWVPDMMTQEARAELGFDS